MNPSRHLTWSAAPVVGPLLAPLLATLLGSCLAPFLGASVAGPVVTGAFVALSSFGGPRHSTRSRHRPIPTSACSPRCSAPAPERS